MKRSNIYLSLIMGMLLASVNLMGQSLSPTVYSSSGGYYEGTSANLSVTVSEPIIDTYTGTSAILNCGFQQGYIINKRLLVKLLLEGIYNGSGGMNKVWGDAEEKWPGTIADTIRIELHQDAYPYTRTLARYGIPLNTDGTLEVLVPNALSGSYYIVPVHRNSIETWSAVPVSFSNSVVNYDFSNDITKAYGDNLKSFSDGNYGIFSGDINSAGITYPALAVKDGVVDSEDVFYVYDSNNAGDIGYMIQDLNGDGVVDSNDTYIAYDNYLAGIFMYVP